MNTSGSRAHVVKVKCVVIDLAINTVLFVRWYAFSLNVNGKTR